jgi:hypothetical protein
MNIRGQCHCGNLSYDLETQVPRSEIEARACDCSFCRVHVARNWSDPGGQATIEITDSRRLQRYRFALKTADFLICQTCGVYLGAILSDSDGIWSTVNLRLSDLHDVGESAASYGDEDVKGRIARRKRVWTPTRLVGDD